VSFTASSKSRRSNTAVGAVRDRLRRELRLWTRLHEGQLSGVAPPRRWHQIGQLPHVFGPCEANNKGDPAGLRRKKGHHTMHNNRTLNRIVAAALLTGSVAIAGLGLASGTAQGEPGLTPLVWQLDDPDDQPPPPEPAPPPPPPPPRQCWALFLPAPCPPPHG
jgi:hypothetical protein